MLTLSCKPVSVNALSAVWMLAIPEVSVSELVGITTFMVGVAGCLLAASTGGLTTYAFPAQDSITLLAVVLMGGVYTFWGPVLAAVLIKLLPEILKNWGLPPDVLTILFGIGVLQAMLTAPEGLAVQFPRDVANLSRKLGRLASRTS